jgi:flagellar hook-associated protein 2
MGQIQTGVGLASGFPIASTVNALMQVAEIPYNDLNSQTATIKQQQVDVNELSSLLLAAQSDTDNLGKAETFSSPTASSSDSSTLSATVTGTPTLGNYQFTPIQAAQQAQYLSSGFQSTSTALGAGTLTFRFGGNVQQNLPLADINGGQGLAQGSIRITDCSGASAEIDLSNATSLADVVNDINSNTTINVTASIVGDGLQLTDNTGQNASSLMVQDVDGGTTAESLGLVGAGVDTTTNKNGTINQIEGQSIVKLSSSLQLSALDDGNGVQTNAGAPDIHYTLSNGDSGYIDLSPIASGSSQVDQATTLGDIITQINAAAPKELEAQIAPDGTSIEVKDLTYGQESDQGNGTFTLTSAYNSPALQELGLAGQTSDNGVIQGQRIIGGLNSVLLSSLNGGQGLGTLGTLSLTNRNGVTTSVDLSSCQTVQDVINAINDKAGDGITAAVNAAGNGIQLTDTTGGTTSNLIVASSDSTATDLGIATNAAATSVNSGDLHLQVVGADTLLSSLNGGAGVATGDVSITDSTGKQATLDVTSSMQTVGEVIQAINQLGLSVQAEINPTGDGIQLVDTGGGTGQLQVAEDGSTTAADLNLLGTGTSQTVDGTNEQVIDGSTTHSVTLAAGDTLSDLVSKINALNAGVTASIFDDGSSLPDRLELTSNQTGAAGQFVVDASGLDFSLSPTAAGTDAVLAVGSSQGSGSDTLVSSASNNFSSVVSGLTLQVQQASASPVSVSVTNSSTNALASLNAFISDYNNLVTHLTSFTSYDATTNTKSDLTDDPTTMELQQQTANLVSGQISTSGSIQSLADLGVTINSDGTLALDQTTFTNAYQSDPDGVQQFFTAANTGFSAQFHNLAQQFAATGTGILSEDATALGTEVTNNQQQLALMQTSLNSESAALTTKFDNMEVAISQLQSELSVINSFSESINGSSSSSGSTSSSSSTSPFSFSNIGSNIGTSSVSSGTSSSGTSSSASSGSSSTGS